MTPLDIHKRLRKEFPGRSVTFEVEIATYSMAESNDKPEPDMPLVTMKIWEPTVKSIPCASLDEGIEALKVRLGMIIPEMELVV